MGAMTRSRSLRGIAAVVVVATLGIAAGTLPRPAGPPPEAYADPDVEATDGAIEFFREKLEEDPNNGLIAGRLADRYVKRFGTVGDLGDLDRAEGWARRALAVTGDQAAARARLASILLARHEFARALAEAERAVAENPDDGGAWTVLHDAALAAGRYPRAREALAELEPGVTREVKSAFWQAARGDERARSRLAAACRRIAMWSRPTIEAWCWTELGHLAAGEGEGRAADRLYAHALEIAPGSRGAVEGLADLAYAREDLETAAALYRRIAVDAHPDLYLRLAEIRFLRGDTAAGRRWERAFLRVAADPERERLYGRELALHRAGRADGRDEALSIARREVDRRPTDESRDVLAWVWYLRGEPVKALAASDRALARGAPTPTMEYHRGRILEALGREGEAKPLLDRALEHPEALDPRARLHARRHGESSG